MLGTETITIKLDRQQIDEIARDLARQSFRCGDCKAFNAFGGHHPGWGTCQKFVLAGLTLLSTEQATALPPQPRAGVHEDFGCNRFEGGTPQ